MKRILMAFTMMIMVVSIFVTGCKPKETETIKIGAILAVSGPASFLGAPEARTIEMLAEQINAAGLEAARTPVSKSPAAF